MTFVFKKPIVSKVFELLFGIFSIYISFPNFSVRDWIFWISVFGGIASGMIVLYVELRSNKLYPTVVQQKIIIISELSTNMMLLLILIAVTRPVIDEHIFWLFTGVYSITQAAGFLMLQFFYKRRLEWKSTQR